MLMMSLLQGCVEGLPGGLKSTSNPTGTNQQATIDNPLQGVEMDLAFVDMAAAVLRTDDMMLNRIPISADDTWPTLLAVPEDKVYKDWLEQRLAQDFDFFLYYGDVKNFFILLDPIKAQQRLFIEMAQSVGCTLEHQLKVISYMPIGCDGPVPKGMESPKASYCELLKLNHKADCAFFDGGLEKELKAPMLSGDLESWVKTPINSTCLVKSNAVTGNSYQNFNAAFRSLLPQSMLDDIRKAEEHVNDISDEMKELYSQKAELKQKHEQRITQYKDLLKEFGGGNVKAKGKKEAKATRKIWEKSKSISINDLIPVPPITKAKIELAMKNENTLFKQDLAEVEKKLEAKEETRDQSVAVYEHLMDKALESPEGTEENIHLAKNLHMIAETVDNNLDKALYGTGIIEAKLAVDIVLLTQNGCAPDQVAAAMEQEILSTGKAENEKDALAMATERFALDVKRGALLIPNSIYLYAEVERQSALLGPKVDYLDKLASLEAK